MYDPLIAEKISPFQGYPKSYWEATTSERIQFPSIQNNEQTPVVIIGGGFTGLSAALTLSAHDQPFILLEANEIGWGCSGRNAGFLLPGSGRLDYSGLAASYGNAVAEAVTNEYYQSLQTVDDLLSKLNIDVEMTNGGYLKIAHNAKFAKKMQDGWQALPQQWQEQYQWLDAKEIASNYVPEYASFGGLFRQQGAGINPLKLAIAMANKLKKELCKVYCNSPFDAWRREGNTHVLNVGNHQIRTDSVILCSNAYTPHKLNDLSKKQFPVLSSVLVTEPLPQDIVDGWRSGLMAMDTRSLKYYYRLLPDNRILFGGRGAVTGKSANSSKSQVQLKQAFNHYFPNLAHIKSAYFWSGWVSVSADDIPHVGIYPDSHNVLYATGYCGSGLAFSSHAGKRLAERYLGIRSTKETEVIYHKPIPAFPFSKFRRIGLRGYYAWHRAMDSLGV